MARPNKSGLAYFNMDTDRYQDTKIKRLKHKHGLAGMAVYDYLLCEIYRDKGYFIAWNEDAAFAVTDYFDVEESTVKEIVNYCAELGLFNKDFLAKGKLTSKSIQTRYMLICKNAKRKDAEKLIPEEMNLIPEETELITEETPITPEVTTQSKVNQSTEYQIIENEKKGNKINTNSLEKIRVREFVYLFSKELDELEQQYNDEDCNWMYDKLNDYKLAKGISYKSDYGAICSWVKRRLEEEKENAIKSEGKIEGAMRAGQAVVDHFMRLKNASEKANEPPNQNNVFRL
ncbi:MAG TPA: DUF4373 domain-containing protein [Bacteroidia bacterium]|nr:DUF4373 domain-containing protein [Bacteroidia bacterium]